MGKNDRPAPPSPQVIQVQAPANDMAQRVQNELLAARPLIDLGKAQFNQQLPFVKQNLADSLANRFGSVENSGGAGTQTIGNTVGPLGQNLATLESQSTQIGAQGAGQALNDSIANAQAQAAVRPLMGLYSPTGQDQATSNLVSSLVNSYRPRHAQNQVDENTNSNPSAAYSSVPPPPMYNPYFSGTGGTPDIYANPKDIYGSFGGYG